MANTTIYLIDSTDGGTTFAIQPRTFDGFGGVQQHTDLTLYGNANPNWGERFNENYYQLLENFAVEQTSAVPLPTPQDQNELGIAGRGVNHPIVGQQWFNKTDTKLYVYTTSGWKSSSSVSTTAPTIPIAGDLWFNTTILPKQLMVHDGTIWQFVAGDLTNFVNKTGDTMTGSLILNSAPLLDLEAATKKYVDDGGLGVYVSINGDTMTGFLTLNNDPTANLHAATKQYVDTEVSNVIPSGVFLPLAGGTMTGFVTLNALPTNVLHAATKGYVDATVSSGNFVDKTGDTMTGFLSLNANPTAALHAATKQYVDAGGSDLVGFVLPFPTNSVPTGFLRCNGAAISRSVYSTLFAAIGTLYGIGDGSTTFNLPDLRGEFIRGFDDGRGVDLGRGIGTTQADEFESHNHSTSTITRTIFDSTGGSSGYGQDTPSGTGQDVNSNFTGGTETRPRNVAMLYCIKY